MQQMFTEIDRRISCLEMPPAGEELLPGVRWGRFDELFTPAFWLGQAWQHELLGTYRCARLGSTLSEEVCACLLGGFGFKAELGVRAFYRLRERGLFASIPLQEDLLEALNAPFMIGHRAQRYRFPRQKAKYLHACLTALQRFDEPSDDVTLRNSLLSLPGVGPKTASWIVRNHRSSSRVAIIDVHILRAGRHMGIFETRAEPGKSYAALETSFLRFAQVLGKNAALLDNVIWDYVRRLAPGRTLEMLNA